MRLVPRSVTVAPPPIKLLTTNTIHSGGLLAPLGDPLGKAVNTGLSPLGAGVGSLTGSISEGASSVTKTLTSAAGLPDRGEEKQKEEVADMESVGGKEPSAENPMGL